MGQLDALAPQSARDMLGMLVVAKLLRLRTVPAPRQGPPPIFGAAAHVKPPAPVRTVVGDSPVYSFDHSRYMQPAMFDVNMLLRFH